MSDRFGEFNSGPTPPLPPGVSVEYSPERVGDNGWQTTPGFCYFLANLRSLEHDAGDTALTKYFTSLLAPCVDPKTPWYEDHQVKYVITEGGLLVWSSQAPTHEMLASACRPHVVTVVAQSQRGEDMGNRYLKMYINVKSIESIDDGKRLANFFANILPPLECRLYFNYRVPTGVYHTPDGPRAGAVYRSAYEGLLADYFLGAVWPDGGNNT